MNFLQNLTIKRRLQLNAVVVGLAMVILLCVIIYESRVTLNLNKTIQLAEELNVHALELRKHEKNFLFLGVCPVVFSLCSCKLTETGWSCF